MILLQRPLQIIRRLGAVALLTLAFYLVIVTLIPLEARTDNPIGQMEYHPDEGVWIEAGRYYFHTFFIERDWSAETWNSARFGSFGKPAPPLGKYLFGAALYLNSQLEGAYQPPSENAGEGFDWDVASQERPPRPVLQTARRPVLVLGALAATVLFLLVEAIAQSTATALLASLLFVLQPLVIRDSGRAMLDMPALFFGLLALLLFVYLLSRLEQRQIKHVILLAIAAGFVLGLAVSTKLSAVLILVVLASWWVLALWRQSVLRSSASGMESRHTRTGPDNTAPVVINRSGGLVLPVIMFLLILLTATITFIALNPLLYSQPLAGLQAIVGLAAEVQQYEVPPQQRLDTLVERLLGVYRVGFVHSGPISYWLRLPFVDAVLVLTGVGFCVYRAGVSNGSLNQRMRATMLLLWAGITVVGIIYWVPYFWLRWYLPLAPIWAMMEALGLVGLYSVFRDYRWQRL